MDGIENVEMNSEVYQDSNVKNTKIQNNVGNACYRKSKEGWSFSVLYLVSRTNKIRVNFPAFFKTSIEVDGIAPFVRWILYTNGLTEFKYLKTCFTQHAKGIRTPRLQQLFDVFETQRDKFMSMKTSINSAGCTIRKKKRPVDSANDKVKPKVPFLPSNSDVHMCLKCLSTAHIVNVSEVALILDC
jgi:hypothetical protein